MSADPRAASLRRPPTNGAVALVGAAAASSMAWLALQAGLKGMFAMTVLVAGAAVFVVVREREPLLLFGLVLSIGFMLHKSFGPIAIDVNGGAPSVYVTALDVVLVVLYGMWFLEGTMWSDIGAALHRPIFWVPLVGGVLTAVSMTVSADPTLVFAELTRMGWMYLLFLYVGVRVRTRRQVWAILAGFGALALLQVLVVSGQWATKSALGLSFLGVPTELGERVLDDGTRHRPFGTVLHPVFMGATVAPIGMLALGLAIGLRSTRVKFVCAALGVLTTVPLVMSNTRAAILGFAVAAPTLVLVQTARGKIPVRYVVRLLIAGLVAMVPAWPFLSSTWHESLKTEHFRLEVESRIELNDIAIEMFESAPVLGVGLNGFQRSMDAFDEAGLIFAGHPVHNIYLLQAAETGLVGLIGMLLIGVALIVVALRLARSTEPLLSSVGAGVAAVHLFFIVEELLVFSLRQDHPLAIYWLLAGLSVACLRMAERDGALPRRAPIVEHPRGETSVLRQLDRHPERVLVGPIGNGRIHLMAMPSKSRRGVRRRRRRRMDASRRVAVLARHRRLAALMVISLVGVAAAQASAPVSIGPITDDSFRIVFSAVERPGGLQAIYTAAADGSQVVRISPEDGADYSWPSWAFGGTKVVFTKRSGPPGSPENLYLMDADGSNITQLTSVEFRLGQPKVSPDGTSVVFSAFWQEFPEVGVYRLDLRTLQVTNLTAVSGTPGGLDGDPRWSPDGSRILFATSAGPGDSTRPTQVWSMAPDGSDRRPVTDDEHYNTDPALSPDGRWVAAASYRGEGTPQRGDDDTLLVKLHDFRLTVLDVESGEERELTQGLDCSRRLAHEPCSPAETSAFVPVWLPGSRAVAFLGALGQNVVCICTASLDGTEHRQLLASGQHEIRWFDITMPPIDDETKVFDPDDIGVDRPRDELLFVGSRTTLRGPRRSLFVSGPDRFTVREVPLPAALEPLAATWSPDRSMILFTARAPVDPAEEAVERTPTPPGGQRRPHVTLDLFSSAARPVVERPEVAEEQVYLVDPQGGGLRRVTSPWTEDHMDAPHDGDLRGNTQPDMSRDGRALLFTNVFSMSHESAILRLELATNEVINLTSGTSGALPVSDSAPRLSPNGDVVAFSSVVGGVPQVFTMSSVDGTGVRQLTDDDHTNVSPVWSPDGRSLAFVSYRDLADMPPDVDPGSAAARGAFGAGDWQLRTLDLLTGEQRLLHSSRGTPLQSPVWSPDGSALAFVALGTGGQPDLLRVPVDGGLATPIQVSLSTSEVSVDWR